MHESVLAGHCPTMYTDWFSFGVLCEDLYNVYKWKPVYTLGEEIKSKTRCAFKDGNKLRHLETLEEVQDLIQRHLNKV